MILLVLGILVKIFIGALLYYDMTYDIYFWLLFKYWTTSIVPHRRGKTCDFEGGRGRKRGRGGKGEGKDFELKLKNISSWAEIGP